MKSSHSILPHTNLDIKTNVKEFLNEGTKKVEFYGIQDFCAKSKVFKSKWTTVQFSTQESFLNKQEIHFKIPLPHLLHPGQLLPLQGPSQLLPGLCKQHNGEESYHSGKKS